MIERCREPAAGCMAGPAVAPELTTVRALGGMACIATGGSTFKDIIAVASGTIIVRMFTGQFKTGHVMVESCR